MDFEIVIITILAVLFSMTFHEWAHALVYHLADRTSRSKERLSLNPFRHIDWMGFLSLLLFGFGWAKPVSVDPRVFKDPKAGMVWTAFAGPVANFILSFVCVFFFQLIVLLFPNFASGAVGSFVISLLSSTAVTSAGFGIFNLIPIPPLDGSKVFWAFLPDEQYWKLNHPPAWISLLFLLVIFSGVLSGPLSTMRGQLIGWMQTGSMAILKLFL